MRIALVGASSSRKSTVAYNIVGRLKAAGRSAELCQEFARKYLEKYSSIDHPFEQLLLFYRQRDLELRAAAHYDYAISDSATFLCYVYYKRLAARERAENPCSDLDKLRGLDHDLDDLTTEDATNYDFIFLLEPAEFIDDGVRIQQDEDSRFHMYLQIKEYLDERGIHYIKVRGTTEDRIETVWNRLQNPALV